jgi:hypothetical protein
LSTLRCKSASIRKLPAFGPSTVMTNYFTVRDGKIARLIVIFSTAASY